MAVGSNDGKVLIYDLRSSHPIRVHVHMNSSKTSENSHRVDVLDIKWHRYSNFEKPLIISTDERQVNIWHPETGENFTSIQAREVTERDSEVYLINDICAFRDSGLILLAEESSQITPFFIPALGPAPNWCSYLDNMTEELDENAETLVYDDHKFLTKQQLEQLNLTSLIGTPHLNVQGHGFCIDYQLYKQAVSLANPLAYEEYIEKRKQEKLETERASHITITRKLPRVNRQLANQLLKHEDEMEEEATTRKKHSKKKGLKSDLLSDNRFALLFENKDFEIDELSPEYLSLHPQASKNRIPPIEEHFEQIVENLKDSDGFSHDSTSSSDNDGVNDSKSGKRQGLTRLYEIKDERHAEAFRHSESLAADDALALAERIARLKQPQTGSNAQVKLGPGGSREFSFLSRSSATYKGEKESSSNGKRRGIQSLELKPGNSHAGRRGRKRRL